MDILTKIRMDHHTILSSLQHIIERVEEEKEISILLEDLLEEIKEHTQAEKVCISEFFLEGEKYEDQISPQIDKNKIVKLISGNLYEGINMTSQDEDLKNKLYNLKKILLEHIQHIEDSFLLFSKELLDGQKSEELSLKFEKEKINTLVGGITYA